MFEQTAARQDRGPLVARITTDPDRASEFRGREALVISDHTDTKTASHNAPDGRDRLPEGFLAYLLVGHAESENERQPCSDAAGRLVMQLSPAMRHLTDGDVVHIKPRHGTLSVIYRRHSPHNTLVPTEMCNCRCIMCPQPPMESDDAGQLDACLQAVRLISPSTVALGISGGEPTMVPEGLLKLVGHCRDWLPNTALQILTNARMFNYLRFARDMAAVGHDDLLFGVGLYSDLPQDHDAIVGVSGAFDETIRGIVNLRRCGLRVELRVVPMRQNVGRLGDLARFIVRNLPFVEHVALMGMEPMGMASRNFERLWVDPADYQAELTLAVDTLTRHRIATSIYNEQLCVLHPRLREFAARSISDWKNIYLEKCKNCKLRDQCGGFFESSKESHSRAIRPLG